MTIKRSRLVEDLVPAARAAANAMKDAGMNNSAAPVSEILFQLDALDEEMKEIFKSHHDAAFRVTLGMAQRALGPD